MEPTVSGRDGGAGADAAARAEQEDALSGWGIVAGIGVLATYLLVVLGGIVRVTGSGMGCGPDWPLCRGRLVPPMDLPTFIEWSHRLAAAGVAVLVGILLLRAWWPDRGEGWETPRRLALLVALLLAVQILIGAVAVRLELPPTSVILHLGMAMALLAALAVASWEGLAGALSEPREPGGRPPVSALGWGSAGAGLAVVLTGALVANLDAAHACQGFPLCNGELVPSGGWRVQLHWVHRLAAYGLVAWLLWLPFRVRRRRPGEEAVRVTADGVAALALLQVGVAASMTLLGLPLGLRIVHVGLGSAIFLGLVYLACALQWPVGGGEAARA